ncbi:MAG: hypothetical protein AAB853_03085 [Patescibacteria group bacterium]
MSEKLSEKQYVTPLEGADVPEVIRGIDLHHLLRKVEERQELTPHQAGVITEDTRYRIAKHLPVAPYGAAYILNLLQEPTQVIPFPGSGQSAKASPDNDSLRRILEDSLKVAQIAEELKRPRPTSPRQGSEGEAPQPRMSVDQCVKGITQALRQGSYDFAVSRAEDALKLFTKTPQVTYIAAIAYAHSAAKNVTAEVGDRITDHKRAIELFDQCLQVCGGSPGYAEIEANARKKRTEVLPMSESLEAMRQRQEKK